MRTLSVLADVVGRTGLSGGDRRAADPGGRARFAGPSSAGAVVAAARGASAAAGPVDGRTTDAACPRGRRAGRSTCACRPRRRPTCPPDRARASRATPTRSCRSTPDGRWWSCSVPRSSVLARCPNSGLDTHPPGPVGIGGLVVTRQHPMTAKGTVFLALEDETGMVNVTLWPDTWARLRGVVRRHALLYVEGTLQREARSSTSSLARYDHFPKRRPGSVGRLDRRASVSSVGPACAG